jgi:hypothetical protein
VNQDRDQRHQARHLHHGRHHPLLFSPFVFSNSLT